MDTTNDQTVSSAADYAHALQQLPLEDLQHHAQWQLTMISNHALTLVLAADALKERDIKHSPELRSLLMVFKRLIAGSDRMDMLLSAGALSLHDHMQELISAKPQDAKPSKLVAAPVIKSSNVFSLPTRDKGD